MFFCVFFLWLWIRDRKPNTSCQTEEGGAANNGKKTIFNIKDTQKVTYMTEGTGQGLWYITYVCAAEGAVKRTDELTMNYWHYWGMRHNKPQQMERLNVISAHIISTVLGGSTLSSIWRPSSRGLSIAATPHHSCDRGCQELPYIWPVWTGGKISFPILK